MPRKRPDLDTNDLIRRYTAGESLYQLSTALHVGKNTIKTILQESGVSIRSLTDARLNRRIPLNGEDILRRYQSGETKKAIAKSLGVNQTTVQRRLADFGITTAPDRSEAARTRLARMTPKERKALARAAHDAVRGKTHTLEQKIYHAQRLQKLGKHGSAAESLLADWLSERGINTVPQQAIGPYNADLGAFPVAVEVFGGNWHMHGRHVARLPERTRHILNSGWNLMIVWVNALYHPLLPDAADDIVSFHQLSRSDPAFRGQYRVIWGGGQFYSAGSVQDDEFTLVPSGHRGQWRRATD